MVIQGQNSGVCGCLLTNFERWARETVCGERGLDEDDD